MALSINICLMIEDLAFVLILSCGNESIDLQCESFVLVLLGKCH